MHARQTTSVAFVPGFMQRAEAWAPVAGHIAKRGWPTRLVDFERPDLPSAIAAIEAAAADKAVVVAYSMGGRLAIQAAARAPGVFNGGLVLVGATPGIEDAGRRRSRRAADEELAEWMESQRIERVVTHWESQSVFATQSRELVRSQRPGRLAHDPCFLANQLRATGQGVMPPVWRRLGKLEIPVLAIAGELDERYARIAQRMARRLPNAKSAIVEGAGHAPQLERPGEVARLLTEFLDEHFRDRVGGDRDAEPRARRNRK
jgi:2-succinyl-6-hydroxy-2,4-cyclohexadiene-1-carboxylate synthase